MGFNGGGRELGLRLWDHHRQGCRWWAPRDGFTACLKASGPTPSVRSSYLLLL